MNDYGITSNEGYRCILLVVDYSSKFDWTIPLKKKYAHLITDSFSQIVKSSKRHPNLLGTDYVNEYVYKIFNEF